MNKLQVTNSYKRILFHHRTQGEGVEGVHIRGMISGFQHFGYQVDIEGPPGTDPLSNGHKVQIGEDLSEGRYLKKVWRILGENMPQIAFEGMELGYNLYAYKMLYKRLHFCNYDFLYERYALNSFVMAYLAQQYELPFVLEVNDATVIERSRPCALKQMARFIEGKVFDKASLLVTISDYFKHLIVHNYKIPEEKILVLPNAIDPKRFELTSSRKLSKEDLGIKAKYIIGFVGAFVHWHGLDFLIKAAYDLLDTMDVHILLIGDGPARKDVDKVISTFDIQERVTITGFIEYQDIPYYIELLDLGLIPDSNLHGSPMKLFEYMAMGIPIIAASYPPIKKLIDDGVDGSLFTPHNKESFKERIVTLLNNDDKRKRMGHAAHEKVRKQFTWQRNAERVLFKIQEKLHR